MDRIESLECEHHQLTAMAEELGGICAAFGPPEPLWFLQFRRKFARLLTSHLKHEDWVVYPSLLASIRPEVRAAASRFFAESMALSTAFRDYSHAWTTDRIDRDWAGFRIATRQILAGLLHRIHVEENELYPLLAQGIRAASLPHAPEPGMAPAPGPPSLRMATC